MKRGFYTIMAAQFFSSLADNALFVAAVELLSIGEVAWINEAAIEASTDYFFARDLSRCPVGAAFG